MPEPAMPGSDAPVPPAVPTGARGRVLLVEDNATNQLVATRMLGKLGYEVDVAANGREAVDATEATVYDAVLMDCQMPEMDGYQATAAIRRREGGVHHTPIIAMTAAAMEGDRDVCIAAGMDDYVAKPVRAEVLLEVLDRWIVREPAAASGEPDGAEADQERGQYEDGPPEAAPLDPERFEVMRELDGGDGELLRLLANEFLTDARRQLEVLREAAGEGEPEVVERAAHSLKGASAAIGAIGLSELCAQLELLGRGGALGETSALLGRVDHELDRVTGALDAMVPMS